MLHYVHHLVFNCVCLMFGAEQVLYSGFLERVGIKTVKLWLISKWVEIDSFVKVGEQQIGVIGPKFHLDAFHVSTCT